ncbi:hypothetical protein KIN20_014226 [Parelaphostrongylus tenuis]|uniref:Uncharacterized protein n=1 Tax=Parelaphostrongylus tenuis TaxID=148309 RepID=A0AAD5MI09_PARTN|nr:hypothetical protein KIN20_014226 [Parelaphostrongylus tenuis]
MASLAAPVVLAAGAALVLSVPVIALKELLEKRFELDAKDEETVKTKKNAKAQVSLESETKHRIVSLSPPGYNELFDAPPPYHTN